MSLHEFHAVSELAIGVSATANMGIDFNDTLQPADFDLLTSDRSYKVKITAPVGELVHAVSMSEEEVYSKQGNVFIYTYIRY